MIIKIIKALVSLYNKYTRKHLALDEPTIDSRDYTIESVAGVSVLPSYEELPVSFALDDKRFQHQWYTAYCTAFSVTTATNTELFVKAEPQTEYSWFVLWDIMVEKGTMHDYGAFVIDAIEEAVTQNYIDSYYQTNSLLEMLTAIYSYTNPICTGSNRIDWSDTADGLVRKKSEGMWHAFNIVGWDKEKKIDNYVGAIKIENSWWENAQDGWYFWIPFDLVEDGILFYTKKAIVVAPEWSKK